MKSELKKGRKTPAANLRIIRRNEDTDAYKLGLRKIVEKYLNAKIPLLDSEVYWKNPQEVVVQLQIYVERPQPLETWKSFFCEIAGDDYLVSDADKRFIEFDHYVYPDRMKGFPEEVFAVFYIPVSFVE